MKSYSALLGWIATRIPGGLPEHAGRPEQPAAPETNIGLAAKEDSGWEIEDGNARLGAGCCAGTRNHARGARNGRVSLTGPADELKNGARLKEVYL
jgi:hypothetical protein